MFIIKNVIWDRSSPDQRTIRNRLPWGSIYLLPTQIRLIKQKCSTLSRWINSGLITLTGRSFNWSAPRAGLKPPRVVSRNRLISWLIWDHGEFNIRGSPRRKSPHGRVDDNDEGNGDGEREQRDERQLGRSVRGHSKSDEDRYAACAQIYCRRASVVYTLNAHDERANINEILTFRETSVVQATRIIYTKEKFLTLKYFQSICGMIEVTDIVVWRTNINITWSW